MSVRVMLAVNLRKHVTGYDGAAGHSVGMEPGQAVLGVARKLEMPTEVKLIVVDGVGSRWDEVLKGDERCLLPSGRRG